MDGLRRQRETLASKAHDLQIRSGSLGAIKATFYGLALATLAHHTWPLFRQVNPFIDLVLFERTLKRRQTLAFKGFLVSSCTIFGLVVGADRALLAHEAEHRNTQERLRRKARIDLARQGKVATEPEIAKWVSAGAASRDQKQEDL